MTRRNYLLYAIIIMVSTSIFAKNPLQWNGLTFGSELEKAVFFESFNHFNHPDVRFQMVSTINSNITQQDISIMKNRLYVIYHQLESKNLEEKSTLKTVKKIHSTLHKKLFSTFTSYAYFNQIFENGTYNCATATALYAWTFDYFDIPYQIVEQRKHVYLIVNDGENDIMVEVTDAKNGVYLIDKQAFITKWKRLNIISKTDQAQLTDEELYRKYINQTYLTIGFKELVADLYTNAAITEQSKGDETTATQLMEKSVFLYPNRDEKFIKKISIDQLTLEVNILKLETLQPLFELMQNQNHQKASRKELKGFYETATRYLMLEKKDFEQHQKLTNYLVAQSKAYQFEDLIEELEKVNSHYLNVMATN